jgi:fatty acid desaturase
MDPYGEEEDDDDDKDDQDAEFAAIVRRLGDPDDRRDRRRVLVGAIIGVIGLVLSLTAIVVDWPTWVALIGLPAMAAADLVGLLTLRGWMKRHRRTRRGETSGG